MDLYNPDILRLSTKVGHTADLPHADYEVMKRSRVCGSHLALKACVTDGVITAFHWHLGVCAVGQAAAGLLTPYIIGLEYVRFAPLLSAVRAMILDGVVQLPKDFEAFEVLKVVHDFPGRHDSVLLPFEALENLFLKVSAATGGDLREDATAAGDAFIKAV